MQSIKISLWYPIFYNQNILYIHYCHIFPFITFYVIIQATKHPPIVQRPPSSHNWIWTLTVAHCEEPNIHVFINWFVPSSNILGRVDDADTHISILNAYYPDTPRFAIFRTSYILYYFLYIYRSGRIDDVRRQAADQADRQRRQTDAVWRHM